MAATRFTFPDPDFRDWDGLHALLTTCFAYMEGRIDPPSSLTRMSLQSLAQKAGEEWLLTGHRGARLIACAYVRDDGTSAYIGKLAVHPDARGQGLGRRAMSLIEVHCRARGMASLQLQTRVELVENHRTFAALGFVKTAETAHQGYDRPTSITMTKTL